MEKLKELYDMYQKSTGISWRKILENNEVSTKSPYYVLKKLGLKAKSNLDCQRKQELKEDFFEKINSEEKAYWLGFMFADGNVCQKGKSFRVKIGLNFNDKEHLEKLSKLIYGQNKVKTYKNGKYEDISEIVFTSKKMGEDLISHGCVIRKSSLVRMPKLEDRFMRFFILGFFDGDGHVFISKRGKKVCGFTSNKNFLEDLSSFLESRLLIPSKIRIRKGIYGSINFGSAFAIKQLRDYFYLNNESLFLPRKRNIFFT